MLAAINPALRCNVRRASRRARRTDSCGNVASVRGCVDDRLTGRWHIVAGTGGLTEPRDPPATGRGRPIAHCLTIVRTEHRNLGSRIIDRLAGRDRYRVIWQDDARGQCVIARRDRRSLWILSRGGKIHTRELFVRVADLRRRGFDTRALLYAHVG